MDEADAFRRLVDLLNEAEAWSETGPLADVQAGSRLHEDDLLTAPYQLSHRVMLFIGGALDHLRTLRTLIVEAHAMPMAAGFTLVRVAIENAAAALWLLEDDDQLTRVQRRLQLAAADVRDDQTAMQALGADDPAEFSARRTRLAQVAEEAGVTKSQVLGKPASWMTIVSAAGHLCKDGVDDQEGLVWFWRLCSGYAHGSSWAYLRGSELEEVGDVDPQAPTGTYLMTVKTEHLFMAAAGAVFVLGEVLRLRDRHRLQWTQSPA